MVGAIFLKIINNYIKFKNVFIVFEFKTCSFYTKLNNIRTHINLYNILYQNMSNMRYDIYSIESK